MAERMSFARVEPKFAMYHKSKGNVSAHLVTTMLGMVGVACLVQRGLVAVQKAVKPSKYMAAARCASLAIWLGYAAAVWSEVPRSVAAASASALVFVALFAAKADLGVVKACACIVAGYVLQDVAHWYFNEDTYQQHSWGATATTATGSLSKTQLFDLWWEHCYYLLPLTVSCASGQAKIFTSLLPLMLLSWANYALDSDSRWGLPFLAAKTRLLVGKLKRPDEVKDMTVIKKWVHAQNPDTDQTSHWWVSDMSPGAQEAFERLTASKTVAELFASKFQTDEYAVEPVHGMNEIYVSAPTKRQGPKTSDDVFFTEHVDGPFCFFPFASVYRCILALDDNASEFETHFPNACTSKAATNGDILAFDFHRESHYITKNRVSDKHRIVLKLHYVAAPTSVFWLFGELLRFVSVKYNQLFRALFLATIKPTSKAAVLIADLGVVGFTVLYNAVEKFVGYANFAYYAVLAIAAFSVSNYAVFLYGSQYLHYLRYIATYYDRKNVAFGTFKRDVLLFKSIALCQLLALYLRDFRIISLLGVAAGYAVSLAATSALGVDGTYFGIELGVVKKDYKFVTKFPYNAIPHPMILSQVAAIASMHLGGAYLRQYHPLLCPIHIALYLTHLLQEAYDVYDGVPWYKQSSTLKAD